MRASAGLVVVGLLAVLFQVAFSEGAEPHITGLPIGVVPITMGVILVPIGLLLGLVHGNARYRTAVVLAVLGTALVAFPLLFVTSGAPGRRPAFSLNEIAFWGGLLLWLGALVVGAMALRDPANARG